MTDINFFKPYKSKAGQGNYFYKTLIILLAVLIIGSFSMNQVRKILIEKQIEVYQSKLEDENIKKQLTLVEETNKERSLLSKYKSDLNTVLDCLETRDVVSNDILDQISSTLPSTINFKTMNITNQLVVIQGVTSTRVAIGEIQHNLKNLAIIKDVYVESISSSETIEGEYTFNLKCYLNGGGN